MMYSDFTNGSEVWEGDDEGDISNNKIALTEDTFIDFSAIAAATATPELDLRIAYETNPTDFIQNYIIDLGLNAYMTVIDAEAIFPNSLRAIDAQDIPLFDSKDLLGSPYADINRFDEQALCLAGIEGNNEGDVFIYENPSHTDVINGFINVGTVHDKVDLRPLLNNLDMPLTAEVRATLVHVIQQGEAVQVTVDGLPYFSLIFADSASNLATNFRVGTDIIISP